jgi:hypothetical protein
MNNEIIQNVTNDTYDDFQRVTSYFHKISFHYYSMTTLTLRYGHSFHLQ